MRSTFKSGMGREGLGRGVSPMMLLCNFSMDAVRGTMAQGSNRGATLGFALASCCSKKSLRLREMDFEGPALERYSHSYNHLLHSHHSGFGSYPQVIDAAAWHS